MEEKAVEAVLETKFLFHFIKKAARQKAAFFVLL